jgi:DNA-binding SARP family transcriptional activator
MSAFQFHLLGKFEILDDTQVPVIIRARKAQELLAYLLLYRERAHSREGLVDLLWPTETELQATKSLRQALWRLHSVLNRPALHGKDLLLISADWISINGEVDFWLDIAELERIFTQTRRRSAAELDEPGYMLLQSAIPLYRGKLLEGWHQRWCISERERIQNIYLSLLDKLIDYAEVLQDYQAGLDFGALMLRCDYSREETYRRLMRLHYVFDNRTAALREYERCVSILQEEFGIGPSEETTLLYHQVRTGQFPEPGQGAPAVGSTHATAQRSLNRVFVRLTQCRTALRLLELQLQEALLILEAELKREG